MSPSATCVLVLLATLVACGPPIPVFTPSEATTDAAASDSSGGGHTSSLVPDEPERGSDGTTSGEPPSTFIMESDAGSGYECDLWIQDCPAGHKCNIWANDGGSSWNATRCIPIVPEPDGAGEPCTVEGNGVSGLDTCDLGAVCWDVDPDTLIGVCREFCTGSEANPTCEDPEMLCGGPRDFPLCLPICCPVEQDCEVGKGCYPVNDSFVCVQDAGGDEGEFGDPCEYINVCDPGLLCISTDAVPDCAGGVGCCTPFCTVGTTTCQDLHPAMECVAWFEEGHAPPGFELTGACVLP